MLFKKIRFIVTISAILLLSIVSVAQAAPPLQEGAQEEDSSLGETLDLDDEESAGKGYNLGTVMSGANGDTDDGADDGTDDGTNDGTDDGSDGDTNGDTDEGDGIDDGTMQHPVASALAGFFNVEYEEVFSLHQEGYGFGVIAFAYFFADATGMSEVELLQAAQESGWGNVLKENGIHPGSIGRGLTSWPDNRNGDDGEEETELEGSQTEDAGPPVGLGRPDHAGPPAGVGGRPDHAGPPAGVSPGNFAGPGGGSEDGGNGRAGDGPGGGNGAAVGRPGDAGGPGGGAGNGSGNRGGRGGGRP